MKAASFLGWVLWATRTNTVFTTPLCINTLHKTLSKERNIQRKLYVYNCSQSTAPQVPHLPEEERGRISLREQPCLLHFWAITKKLSSLFLHLWEEKLTLLVWLCWRTAILTQSWWKTIQRPLRPAGGETTEQYYKSNWFGLLVWSCGEDLPHEWF